MENKLSGVAPWLWRADDKLDPLWDVDPRNVLRRSVPGELLLLLLRRVLSAPIISTQNTQFGPFSTIFVWTNTTGH